MSTDTTTHITPEQAAELIGTGLEHLTPTMHTLVQRIQDGERCDSDAARLVSQLISRTASLRAVRADADYLRWRLRSAEQLARNEQRQHLVLADRARRDEDAVEVGRRELARRELDRLWSLPTRRRARQRALRQKWAQELRARPPRQRSICPAGLARALRRRCGEGGHVDVLVVPGQQAPTSSGSGESGLQGVAHPTAYALPGGRPQYVCSTELIEVGRGWLRDHIGGLAREQAEVDVH